MADEPPARVLLLRSQIRLPLPILLEGVPLQRSHRGEFRFRGRRPQQGHYFLEQVQLLIRSIHLNVR